jgi:hypothetical protein
MTNALLFTDCARGIASEKPPNFRFADNPLAIILIARRFIHRISPLKNQEKITEQAAAAPMSST